MAKKASKKRKKIAAPRRRKPRPSKRILRLRALKGWRTRRANLRKRSGRSISNKKGAATRRLKREGIEKLDTEYFGERKLRYDYYSIPELPPDLVQKVIYAAQIGRPKGAPDSVAIVLDILEEKSKEIFTNQTEFILWDEPNAATLLVNSAEILLFDPSPDITGKTSKKPVYNIVGVTVVIQRAVINDG